MILVTLVLMSIAGVVAATLACRHPAAFVLFLLPAGILRFSSDAGQLAGGSMDLSALWLLCLILSCGAALVRAGAFRFRLSAPEVCYLMFLIWCVFEAVRAKEPAFATRAFLKLIYPFLVMFVARVAIRSQSMAARILPCLMGTAFGAFLLIGGPTHRLLSAVTSAIASLTWPGAAFADYAAIMCVMALCCWRLFNQRKYLWLAILLATSSAFVTIRTGVLATAVGVAIFCLLEFGRRSVPLLMAVYLAAATTLFVMPEFRSKMFFDDRKVDTERAVLRPDSIETDNIHDSGRFTLWPIVLDRFFWPNPVFGSGLGATQAWFYSLPFGSIKVEHNEYIKVASDTGIIGLSLFITTLISCMVSAWRVSRASSSAVVQVFCMGVLAGMPAFMVCMMFDNALLYVLCAAQYPFAFTGILLGLREGERKAAVAPQSCGVEVRGRRRTQSLVLAGHG